MSADWIKIRSNIKDDPDVVVIAGRLGTDEFSIVGRLHAVWAWLDQHSEDGTNVRITSAYLDRLTACPGFADAMRAVGWLDGRDGALLFPNFQRHNGESAKARASETKRKARQRNGTNVPDVVPEKPGPEKRREEKITNPKNTPPREKPPKAALGDADEEWIKGLEAKDCYKPLGIRIELGKAQTWCEAHKRQCTRKFFVNWLNRALENVRTVTTAVEKHTEKSRFGF